MIFGKNIDALPVHVMHSSLKDYNIESAYRKFCPVCNEGALLVQRDQETFDLINVDRCIRCAQLVIYDDETINDEPVKKKQ